MICSRSKYKEIVRFRTQTSCYLKNEASIFTNGAPFCNSSLLTVIQSFFSKLKSFCQIRMYIKTRISNIFCFYFEHLNQHMHRTLYKPTYIREQHKKRQITTIKINMPKTQLIPKLQYSRDSNGQQMTVSTRKSIRNNFNTVGPPYKDYLRASEIKKKQQK